MKRIKWANLIKLIIGIILTGVLVHDSIMLLKGATYTYLGLITGMFMICSIAFIYDDLFNEGDWNEDTKKRDHQGNLSC